MATAKASQNDDWLKSQQQYWDQWFRAQKNVFEDQMKNGAQLQSQWSAFFREWQEKVSPSTSQGTVPGAEAWQGFFTQGGKQFLDMLQHFHQKSGQDKTPADIAQEWVESLKGFFGQPSADAAETYKGFTQLQESLLKAGQAWTSSFQQPGQPGLGSFDPFGFAASMPGIGYTREKQEELNELYRRWAAFERMTQKYNAAMTQVGLEAAQKFQAYVANPPEGVPPLKSIKEIYVKWVDICEDIYARYAVTKEYTDLYGDTVNALMAYRQQLNKLTDDAAAQFNLPTRKEVDSLHERLHALRRENIELKKDVAELRKAVFGEAKPAKAKPAAKAAKKGKAGK